MLNFDPGGRTGSESIFINYLFSAVLSWTQNNPEQASRNPKISNPFQPLLAAIHWFLSYEWTCIPPPPFQQKPAKTKPFAKKSNSSFDLQQLETWIMSLQIWRENPSTKIDSSKNSIFCFKMIGDFVRSIVEQICLGAWICAQSWLTFLIIFDLPGAPQQGID